MTPLDTIWHYEELGLHPERTDPQEMILSRMDSEALTKLAEEGDLEDVQAIVLSLVWDNPQMEQYLADFQQTNDTAFVTELREAAAEEVGIVPDTPEASETEEMTPEEMIQHAKEFLYSSLDISEDEASNGALTNFAKWIVDTLIIWNAELALQVIETKGQVILEALKNLASWSGIKQVLSALGESIWDLFTGSAYEKGKAVADLWLVATGLGAGISVGKKVLKTAVKSLDVPSAKNLDSLLLDDVAKLPPAERLEAAWVFLGRKEMSQAEQEAIILAHNTGTRLPDGSYSYTDLRAKVEILQEAGFQSDEIRILFDKNICGTEYPSFKSLYEDPRYSFLNTEPYVKLKEMLGDLDINDRINEWQNAIILRHPTDDTKVLKIAKPGAVDELEKEFTNHQRFYIQLEKWRKESREMFERWEIREDMVISDNIKIPEVQKASDNSKLYFEMERVEWQSFRSEYYREKYASKFSERYTSEELDTLTDWQIEELVWDLWLQHVPARIMNGDNWWEMAFKESQNYMWKQFKKWEGNSELGNVMMYLQFMKHKHTDLHAANFMRAKDGKIYIIDFGNVTIE